MVTGIRDTGGLVMTYVVQSFVDSTRYFCLRFLRDRSILRQAQDDRLSTIPFGLSIVEGLRMTGLGGYAGRLGMTGWGVSRSARALSLVLA
jgi:hypothetical protein